MFVFSVKMSKRQILTLLFCIALLIVMVIAAVRQPSSSTAAVSNISAEGGSETKRVAFLRSLGYTVTPPYTEVEEILIPDEFDEETIRYNELQQTAGMDLSPYHGKRVKCWTYTIQGDPSGQEVEAHLYEYKDRIIGGDVSAKAADGFMRALVPVDKG